MLYGMGDAEKQALVDLGYRLRIYMPYGELIPGMAYLVRRLLENTSNDSFLRASFAEHVSAEKLLMNPWITQSATDGAPRRCDAAESPRSLPSFHNEPLADFAPRSESPRDASGRSTQVRAQCGPSIIRW